ncbi:hypothetical protein SMMN14_00303 [Sphaerulina musiva]
MASLFSSLFSRAPQVPENVPFFPYKIADNPYQCKKTWPPDFTKLSQKHQFRLERRYRRRAKLKWARPNWTKGVKLAQWGSIVFVCVYGVLFLDVGDGGTPFDGIRKTYREQIGGGGSQQANTKAARDLSPTANQPS